MAAAGGALSLLLGSGLLALVSDSVISEDNNFTSGTFSPAPPPSHDVKAGVFTSVGQPCDASVPLEDGPLPAMISGQTLTLSGGLLVASGHICVRNEGDEVGRLRVALANVVDTEEPSDPCNASEAAAGDATCGFGAGELAAVAVWSIDLFPGLPGTSTSCAATPFVSPAQSAIVDADLGPGQTCHLRFLAKVADSASDAERLRAQRDRLQFDIAFTLEDISAP